MSNDQYQLRLAHVDAMERLRRAMVAEVFYAGQEGADLVERERVEAIHRARDTSIACSEADGIPRRIAELSWRSASSYLRGVKPLTVEESAELETWYEQQSAASATARQRLAERLESIERMQRLSKDQSSREPAKGDAGDPDVD